MNDLVGRTVPNNLDQLQQKIFGDHPNLASKEEASLACDRIRAELAANPAAIGSLQTALRQTTNSWPDLTKPADSSATMEDKAKAYAELALIDMAKYQASDKPHDKAVAKTDLTMALNLDSQNAMVEAGKQGGSVPLTERGPGWILDLTNKNRNKSIQFTADFLTSQLR